MSADDALAFDITFARAISMDNLGSMTSLELALLPVAAKLVYPPPSQELLEEARNTWVRRRDAEYLAAKGCRLQVTAAKHHNIALTFTTDHLGRLSVFQLLAVGFLPSVHMATAVKRSELFKRVEAERHLRLELRRSHLSKVNSQAGAHNRSRQAGPTSRKGAFGKNTPRWRKPKGGSKTHNAVQAFSWPTATAAYNDFGFGSNATWMSSSAFSWPPARRQGPVESDAARPFERHEASGLFDIMDCASDFASSGSVPLSFVSGSSKAIEGLGWD